MTEIEEIFSYDPDMFEIINVVPLNEIENIVIPHEEEILQQILHKKKGFVTEFFKQSLEFLDKTLVRPIRSLFMGGHLVHHVPVAVKLRVCLPKHTHALYQALATDGEKHSSTIDVVKNTVVELLKSKYEQKKQVCPLKSLTLPSPSQC